MSLQHRADGKFKICAFSTTHLVVDISGYRPSAITGMTSWP